MTVLTRLVALYAHQSEPEKAKERSSKQWISNLHQKQVTWYNNYILYSWKTTNLKSVISQYHLTLDKRKTLSDLSFFLENLLFADWNSLANLLSSARKLSSWVLNFGRSSGGRPQISRSICSNWRKEKQKLTF